MTPRLMGLPIQLATRPFQQASPLAFLLPQFQPTRQAHILASLSDNPSAYNKRIRRGRGPASGKGKTSGRGQNGQKQHGKVPAHFNGGQTPDEVVHGERGGKNPFSVEMAPINLNRIQEWIDQGRISAAHPITVRELTQSRCIHQHKDGVKLLGGNDSGSETESTLKQPIHLVVSRASASAIAAVEATGGSVTTRYYTRRAIELIMKREIHPFLSRAWSAQAAPEPLLHAAADNAVDPDQQQQLADSVLPPPGFRYRLPDPTRRRDIEYYRDPAHRGYLSHLLKPTEGPSLFFRSPEDRKMTAGSRKEKVLPANRLW
ncbi:hypothetical protein NUU61_006499 [Penicillium alfredii]|uniref:Large ribosomal subunit protein uL15/eL18 domain-containing protein n=1 Tax=Penicillium alfredii TaxID=1506179 RepID=A0A9W9F139_9EURO|nr:uncharacterized protein NUU61_006499 [Penicillium alfredii]KAJ5091629.1 hypothetical protein NUU61_006499 [Penicillium alfredii]